MHGVTKQYTFGYSAGTQTFFTSRVMFISSRLDLVSNQSSFLKLFICVAPKKRQPGNAYPAVGVSKKQ